MFETIVIILLIMFIIIYKLKYKSPAIAIEAFNHKTYLVNDLPDSYSAADMIANIMINLEKLVNNIINDNLHSRVDKYYIDYIIKIKKCLSKVKISENPTDSKYTSYSVNKGEALVLCIRDKISLKIHDLNELMYVAIHEIAHIGCPEVGHTELFKKINVYLLEKAVCYDLYKYIDYSKYNKNYCGMILSSTILPNEPNCSII